MSTAFSRWLRFELSRRGYKLGPRQGGMMQFATDAGLSPATASRTVGGQQEPTIDTLRKIAQLWDLRLGQLMVIAELVTPEELGDISGETAKLLAGLASESDWVNTPPEDLWTGLIWETLSLGERYLWHLPDSSREMRMRLAMAYQALMEAEAKVERLQRGDEPLPNPVQLREANGALDVGM